MIVRSALVLMAACTIAACANVDRGRCLEGHMQVVMVPMIIGKSTIMTTRMQSVCDQWESPGQQP